MSTGRWCVLPEDIALDKSLSMAEFRVLAVIACHCDENGRCKLTLATIADNCGIASETVRKAVRSLEKKHHISKVRSRDYCEYTVPSAIGEGV